MKMIKIRKVSKIGRRGLVVAGLLMIASLPSLARDKYETIDATAWGTSTQMGQNIGITVIIYDWSTAADRQILVDAFQKGQSKGLATALSKLPSHGRITIPGSVGYELTFIRMIPTPTGRTIRFITQRPITMGEAYTDALSMSYNLTAGEFELNDQDKSKSTGKLYPAAQLTVDKQGELQWDLTQNPWRLGNIIDWKGTTSEN
jgi:hypothetical protein